MTINEANYNEVLLMRQQVMYPNKDIDFVKLQDDEMGIHMGIYEAAELIGVVSIFMGEDRSLQFRKLAIRKDMQGKGYGSALLKWLLDYAYDVDLKRVWANARSEALEFYKKEGFQETSEHFTRDGYNYVVVEARFTSAE